MIYAEGPFVYRVFYWTNIWKTPPNAKLYHQYLSVFMEKLKLVCLRDWTEPLWKSICQYICICSMFKIQHLREVLLGWKGDLMNMQMMLVQLIDYQNSAPLPTLQSPQCCFSSDQSNCLTQSKETMFIRMFVEWTCLACLNLVHRSACILRACLWLYMQREGMRFIYQILIKIYDCIHNVIHHSYLLQF